MAVVSSSLVDFQTPVFNINIFALIAVMQRSLLLHHGQRLCLFQPGDSVLDMGVAPGATGRRGFLFFLASTIFPRQMVLWGAKKPGSKGGGSCWVGVAAGLFLEG